MRNSKEISAELEAKMKAYESAPDAERESLASEIRGLTQELEQAQIDELARKALANQRTFTPKESAEINKRFSISKLIRQSMEGGLDGIEKEMDAEGRAEAKRSHGNVGQGVFLPLAFLRTYYDQTASETGYGAEFVDVTKVSFLDAIHNEMVARRLGVTFLDNLQGNVKVVKGGAASASWAAEATQVTKQKIGYTVGSLSPKRVQAIAGYTYDLLHQSSLQVDRLIMKELVASIASALDTAILCGSGSNGQPYGIMNTSGVNDADIDTNGGPLTYNALVKFETLVGEDNGLKGRLAYVTNAKVLGKMKTTPQIAGYPLYLVNDGKANGYDLVVTNEIPSTLTKGTTSGSCSGMIFGDFEQVLVGGWGGVNLIADPFSKKDYGIIEVSADSYHDVLVRRPDHFAVAKDITTV